MTALAILALVALRLIAAAWTPLAFDEAYYWMWSKHLAGGYYDHPPMVAVVIWLGMSAAFENLHQLMDRVPEGESFERVRSAAAGVEGVLEVEKIRIQHAGPDAHVDIDIEVDPAIRVDEAHRIAQHVRAKIQSAWPSVREVVVHVEPFYAGDH